MRAVIYARFSTDLQSERSIEDQVALCRSYCDREQLTVVAVYQDRAKSGASIFGRDGLIDLMAQAKRHAFDVLVVEHTDRIARSMRDLSDVHERLTFLGIGIRAIHSGAASMDTAMIGLFGLVGQMQREDGAKKVRRGMAGVVRDGRHAGGRAYGYAPISGKPGELAIVEAEAAIVRRIFAAYVAGGTPRAIAGALNAEGVAPPRGLRWNASTVNGNGKRGSGILQNDLYAGRIVWNKVRMIKDPETGRRISRPNRVEDHQAINAPGLAIVASEIFQAVQARKETRSTANGQPQIRTPRRILSGLLRCGVCGSGMSAHDKDRAGKVRLRCSAVRESGACSHKRTYYAEAIEAATINGLREELRNPQAIAEYVKEYRAERKRLAGDVDARRTKLSTRKGAIGRELDRLVDALAQGLATAATIGNRLLTLEAEQRQVEEELAGLENAIDVVALHPAAVSRYVKQIEDLSTELTAGADLSTGTAAGVFRSLVESVTVHPVPPRAPLDIEIRGYLTTLTNDPAMAPSARVYGLALVAEDRYRRQPTLATPMFLLRPG